MKFGFNYSWGLLAGDLAQVQGIIERLRQHAIELGGDAGEVTVLTGEEAEAALLGARFAVLFTATMPGTTEGTYGLAAAGNTSWSGSGAVVASDVRRVSELHAAAADLGLEVVEEYAGMIFTSKKNGAGVVVTEQRQAFDWTDF